jgi:hypothetical protein
MQDRDVLGFKLKTDDKGWKTFDAGSCEIALHGGASGRPSFSSTSRT